MALVGLLLIAGCSDDTADGSADDDVGASAESDESGIDGGEVEPGPQGPGCDQSWEGWWSGAAAQEFALAAEGSRQTGLLRGRSAIDARPVPPAQSRPDTSSFRSTLISEAAVLSTGRNLAVSWCLGNIFPPPDQGPGVSIDPELDALNPERYLLLRRELEAAIRTWERHSRMNFSHLVPLDDRRSPKGGACDTALEHVWFRAQTGGCSIKFQGSTNAGGENEFDPTFASPENPEGSERLLCVAWQFLEAAKTRIPFYTGHESGHIVGLEHEHIRWDQSGGPDSCLDNVPFVPVSLDRILTPADPWSVMGYHECVGSEDAKRISPDDMLGAYYAFNWAERRVRDTAPQVAGESRRLWSGSAQPGILWYLNFPDRLLEWRFDKEQLDSLEFEVIPRCIGQGAPCQLTDGGGHWHPVVGRFTGSAQALDVFMYSPDQAADILLRNRSLEGSDDFERIDALAPDRAIPVVGNFGGPHVQDQILWYRPGSPSEQLWTFSADGQHEVVDAEVEQDAFRIPITGHFRSRSHWTDIIWFEPSTATVDTWIFTPEFSVLKSGASSIDLLGVGPGVEYLPVVGNFDGDNRTDLFWYAPGTSPDWLWLSDSNQIGINFNSFEFTIDGEYDPITGDFDGDGDDDILWYRSAAELAGGPSWLWYFDGSDIEAKPLTIEGDYVPYTEDFDGDGCTDILWYDPVAPLNPSPVWRCLPQQQTFSCGESLPTPKASYPVGVDPRGY